MDLEAALVEINKLPVVERIRLVQRVLDGIAEEKAVPSDLEFTPEFRAELDRRIAAGDADPGRGIPWEIVEAESAAREEE